MTEGENTPSWTRLGLIAGGGDLPLEIARSLQASHPFILRLQGFTDPGFDAFEGETLSIGQIGAMIKSLKAANCDAVCFAGYVTRPDLKDLKMDARGLIMVPKALAAGRKGDDALIRVVVGEFEGAGFQVVGANDLLDRLMPQAGILGAHAPDEAHQADIDTAVEAARVIGGMDIGQGVVCVDGVVLAVEAQEGTNAMLERVAALPSPLRGDRNALRGVLAKIPKPIQERRVDLPTIGMDTVQRCLEAGLAGIVLEAGGALIVDRANVISALDDAGLFLLAITASAK
jgi:DUF1009 family protein